MKHSYKITGMQCNGCVKTVTSSLSGIEGIININISLPDEAVIEKEHHVALKKMQNVLNDAGSYVISAADKHNLSSHSKNDDCCSSGTTHKHETPKMGKALQESIIAQCIAKAIRYMTNLVAVVIK